MTASYSVSHSGREKKEKKDSEKPSPQRERVRPAASCCPAGDIGEKRNDRLIYVSLAVRKKKEKEKWIFKTMGD